MKIIKNWFFKSSQLNSKNIILENNLNVIIFDDLKNLEKIKIWENSRLEIYWYLDNNLNYDLNIELEWENSSLKLWYLLLSWNEEQINAKINVNIKQNNSKANIKIISIVWNNWKIDLNWILKIDKNINNIVWDLVQDNLFIWDKWIIKSIPSLFVWSNDVKASHSCKIEKISDEKLFYLRSRWINKDESINMMLESYSNNLFKCLTMIDNDYYINLNEKIHSKIKNLNLNK